MYEYTYHGEFIIIKLTDELNEGNPVELKEWITNKFLKTGYNKTLLDISELKGINSHTIGILINLHRRVSLLGGELSMLAPKANVRRVLEMTRVSSFIKTYESLNDIKDLI
ncbi:MAG: STAS domain-containing protein [Fervidobacterium sp.]|nr:STAS domain-containing protein [Fervidobacterium sp.]